MSDPVVITIARTLPCTAARLFRALVSPDDLNQWVWAGLGENPTAEVDLRIGGRFCFEIDADFALKAGWPRKRVSMRGLFVEIALDRRLVYTLHWDAPVGYNQSGEACPDELIFIDLEPKDGGVEMRYVHHGVPDEQSAALHRQGIIASHDLLEKVVAA